MYDIFSSGGDEIQRDCTDHVRQNGKLSEGETYCSTSGKLSCKMIVHACGPTWKGGMNQESDRLTDCIESALIETQKRGCKSIAIPALCTGIFGYPIKQATTVIVKALKSCLKNEKHQSIKEVVLCDVRIETVKCFTEALKQEYKGKVTVFNKNVVESGIAQGFQSEKKGRLIFSLLTFVRTALLLNYFWFYHFSLWNVDFHCCVSCARSQNQAINKIQFLLINEKHTVAFHEIMYMYRGIYTHFF